MLLAAGGAACEVRAQAGERRVGVLTGELELDVAIELVEALVAADLRLRRPEQPVQRLVQIRSLGDVVSSGSSRENPCSSRCARSFRRASCSVL